MPKASKPVTIDIHSSTDQWKDISPYFASYQGNNLDRYYRGYGGLNYKQEGNKNDIVGAKVARDDEFIYFMVDTREDIHIGDNFMRLLIDVEDTKHKEAANWETFEYIVNRVAPGDKAIVERSVGGWNWEKVGEVDYSINGNRLQLKVPKAMLGIDRDEFTINFKWSDNMKDEGDIMDFYVNGNVAPGGRFKYRYSTATEDANPVSTFVKYIVPVLVFVIVASFGLAILFKKNRKRKG